MGYDKDAAARELRRRGRFTIAYVQSKGIKQQSRVCVGSGSIRFAPFTNALNSDRRKDTKEYSRPRRSERRSEVVELYITYTLTSIFLIFIASKIIKEDKYRTLMSSREKHAAMFREDLHLSLHKYIIYSSPIRAPIKTTVSFANGRYP